MTNEEFWNPIILHKDGRLKRSQIMKELDDYRFMLEQVPKVYMAVSNGLLSKPMYFAETIITQLEDNFYDKECVHDDIKEILKGCDTLKELKKELRDYFQILK